MVAHVTKKEAAAVLAYANDVAAALRLPRWQIHLMSEPAEQGRSAEIARVEGRWAARLWLSADWMREDYDDRRDTITHEVCHLLHAGVEDVVVEDSRHLMHDHEHDDWDHLASFLADTHTLRHAWDLAHGRTSTPTTRGRQ